MEKVNTLRHKGFETDFYVTSKVKEFLDDRGMDPSDIRETQNTWEWYEAFLFEVMDSDPDNESYMYPHGGREEEWSPEKIEGKEFKVVYNEVIERWVEEGPEGIEEDFEYDESKYITDSLSTMYPEDGKPFSVKAKVLKK